MPRPRQPDPAAFEGDHRIPAALGSVAWAIALVILLAMGDSLPREDRWWIGVCLTGLALGLFALAYIPHIQRRGDSPAPDGAGSSQTDGQDPASAQTDPESETAPDAADPGTDHSHNASTTRTAPSSPGTDAAPGSSDTGTTTGAAPETSGEQPPHRGE
ncbi:DUF2530 domain-containing protein [Lipingzhangella sp. LS1_29]|uniref:DUF2530 domain-containing protein n=1 Tax=Lipingzhangella rawalii TaxID=2055835 RepID=A0ABU2H4G5_9ACTN|nr:DUF2530 domain-containing protein [Lipingzhangella rawalii]MDS1270191.1 DUF2530 domain-containing protein [Lipingzhangella rawalii]